MSQLKDQLRLMIPRLAKEANQLRDREARRRWMQLRAVALSSKSISKACAAIGCSEDFFNKWGQRLIKARGLKGLLSRSRKPHGSPRKTKRRIEQKVLKIRRVEPYLGPERISMEMEDLYDLYVAPSTVFAILKRALVVGKKIASKLTKKHMKRYRRPWPGYLQMDFKYVPFVVDGQQLYQLSCVDHHSSWRFIRCYRNKNLESVLQFLRELKLSCPFMIIEIQTDNDAAFTDKFTSQRGVTGEHAMDVWCKNQDILHRLIPVGVKELNGKVENTHKQDDREFFSVGTYKSYEELALNMKGYGDRWNNHRATRALGSKTPSQVLEAAYVRALALTLFFKTDHNRAAYNLDAQGNAYLHIPEPAKRPKNKIKTRKPTAVETYLKYLEWDDAKKKLPALILDPSMFQNFSQIMTGSLLKLNLCANCLSFVTMLKPFFGTF